MCGRYALWTDKGRVIQEFGLIDMPVYDIARNLAPGQPIPVVRRNPTKEAANCVWGFIPAWARDTRITPINARSETVASKPFFREAFRNRRCLIPANGYFEWQHTETRKQPYYIHQGDDLLAFAGIWSRATKRGEPIDTVAIITTPATPALEEIHPRMPAIIQTEHYFEWVVCGTPSLLRPFPGHLDITAVGHDLNFPRS